MSRATSEATQAGPNDHGGVVAEYAAIFPVVLVVILICFEALMAATTVERIENAARTGRIGDGKVLVIDVGWPGAMEF